MPSKLREDPKESFAKRDAKYLIKGITETKGLKESAQQRMKRQGKEAEDISAAVPRRKAGSKGDKLPVTQNRRVK